MLYLWVTYIEALIKHFIMYNEVNTTACITVFFGHPWTLYIEDRM